MRYIIHRGITSNNIKENTYLSIRNALYDKEALGVEFDIRLTKDKKIVLSHDSMINLNYIENMNYRDVIKYKNITVLDKVLDINSNKIFLIDIKTNNNYQEFSKILIKYLSNYKNKNIYLASFDRKIINILKKNLSNKMGYISFIYKKNNNKIELINYKMISNKRINRIKNKELFLWTIHTTIEEKEIINKFSNINKYYIIKDKHI